MDVEKLGVIMNAFVVSQFSYCTLVWMFHDRSVNKKISKIHKRTLRIACQNSLSNFADLLWKAKTVSTHYENVQLLATEISKAQMSLSPTLMNHQIFVEKDTPCYGALQRPSIFFTKKIESYLCRHRALSMSS